MDYKSVLEEQIKELQKLQERTSDNFMYEKVNIARTIKELCESASNWGT